MTKRSDIETISASGLGSSRASDSCRACRVESFPLTSRRPCAAPRKAVEKARKFFLTRMSPVCQHPSRQQGQPATEAKMRPIGKFNTMR